jgi:hypothetical protein
MKYPGYFLLFLLLAFPMVLSLLYVKAALFAVLLLSVGISAGTSFQLGIHPRVLTGTLLLSGVGLFFSIYGLARGNPGALQCAQVYALWPLVYTLVLGRINSKSVLEGIEKTILASTIFIGIFGVVLFLSVLNILPQIPFSESLFATSDLGVGLHGAHVELAFPGLNSLPFLVPFVLALAATRRQGRLWPCIAAIATLPIVILSGRRALQLVTILSPVLIYGFTFIETKTARKLSRRRMKLVLAATLLLVPFLISIFAHVSEISLSGLKERFAAGFDFSDSTNDSGSARAEQYRALTASIADRPLLGYGLGASNHESVRSTEMPWAYELYYVALLYQVGVVGFVAYSIGMLWIYFSTVKSVRSGSSQPLIPVLVGMTSMLIANGTNPYLTRFDGLWTIFLPLAYVNYELLRRRNFGSDSQLSCAAA